MICFICLYSRLISEIFLRGYREIGGLGVEDYFINIVGNFCVDIVGMIIVFDGCSCKVCVFVFFRDEIGSYWGN